MKFEELRKLIIKEAEGTLPVPDNIKLGLFKNSAYKRLIQCIWTIGNPNAPRNDEFYLNHIRKNPLVISISSIEENRHLYRIETIYGSGIFCRFEELFKNGKVPAKFKVGMCYSVSVDLAMSFEKQTWRDATILAGIAKIPSFFGAEQTKKPFLHAVCAFNIRSLNERVVADFNNDIIMSEQLYKVLFNFKVLEEVKYSQIKDIFEKQESYVQSVKRMGLKKENIGTDCEVCFCHDEMMSYVNAVINGTAKPYNFVTRENYKNILAKEEEKVNLGIN